MSGGRPKAMPGTGDVTKEEAIELCRGPFGKVMRELAASYVAPVFWEERNKEGGIRLRNSTMFFMDVGEGPFAVTARHVYQGYRAAKKDFPETEPRRSQGIRFLHLGRSQAISRGGP